MDGIEILTERVATLIERVAAVQEDVKEIKTSLKDEYVCNSEFAPVRNVVYSFIGVILLAVIGALVTLVVRG